MAVEVAVAAHLVDEVVVIAVMAVVLVAAEGASPRTMAVNLAVLVVALVAGAEERILSTARARKGKRHRIHQPWCPPSRTPASRCCFDRSRARRSSVATGAYCQ